MALPTVDHVSKHVPAGKRPPCAVGGDLPLPLRTEESPVW